MDSKGQYHYVNQGVQLDCEIRKWGKVFDENVSISGLFYRDLVTLKVPAVSFKVTAFLFLSVLVTFKSDPVTLESVPVTFYLTRRATGH